MTLPVRRIAHPAEGDGYLSREWIVTNGLGGYASGAVSGIVTRRYHGLLVAALPVPVGRMIMLSHADARLRLPSGETVLFDPQSVSAAEPRQDDDAVRALPLVEFRLEGGMPIWRFGTDDLVVEKQVVMPHRQNTVHLTFRILCGPLHTQLELRPFLHIRHYESSLHENIPAPYTLTATDGRFEVSGGVELPTVRLLFQGRRSALTLDSSHLPTRYPEELSRGYAHQATLWSPGYFHAAMDCTGGQPSATLVASTEPWETIDALTPSAALASERARRQELLEHLPEAQRPGLIGELALAADQFLISPAARPEDAARALALGTEARTVIAGYHWFTDWGRDTMISLEGLTLATGRAREARLILRTFASYARDGLIPNMFPDGQQNGLYHTADATLWFFHAIARYIEATEDVETLTLLLPVLADIVDRHVAGTRFGIGVDPGDGLLRQGEAGYQLTWMDAKVDGWVVTPRRGKAVEINALFYNALRLLEGWLRGHGATERAVTIGDHASRARTAFNARFWNEATGFLYDVVDGEAGDDPACRPNQLLSISLTHPVLDQCRWSSVLESVERQLVTPFGLRTLSRDHPSYQPRYDGDLRARDAAYHQGTVWPWLFGPYVDAWLKVHPDGRDRVRTLLDSMGGHLSDAGIGTVSEIFDAEPPYRPRGCISQAWSVAELLRVFRRCGDLD